MWIVGFWLASVETVRGESATELVGAWHTASIDGDALFFVVQGVEVDFRRNGTFVAHIRYTDGSTETKNGTFEIHAGDLDLQVPSMQAKERGTFEIKDHVLTFHDASFGVTIELDRGKAMNAAGDSLF